MVAAVYEAGVSKARDEFDGETNVPSRRDQRRQRVVRP